MDEGIIHSSTQAGRRSKGVIMGLEGALIYPVIGIFMFSLIGWSFVPMMLGVEHNVKLAVISTVVVPFALYWYLRKFVSGQLPHNQGDIVTGWFMGGSFLDELRSRKSKERSKKSGTPLWR